ncbi:MAG: hypothetical protein KAI64_00120 [Thermoplasmata archaeon]|nr:hypothetical protein [Thermoplasmata archaeon]
MTKDKAKKTQRSKEQEGLYEAWLDFSNNVNERIMKFTKEGTREYDQLYGIWSEYAQKMTEKLTDLTSEDKKAIKEMQSAWTEHPDEMGKWFADLVSTGDGPYKELYELYADYSEKMAESLSELMNQRINEQKDLYELWTDTFGTKDNGSMDDIHGAMEEANHLWLETWRKSGDILSPDEEKTDHAAKYRELNDLWTKTYSKMIMNVMKSGSFAEMNGTILNRNLETMQLNEGVMNQYLNLTGLPTKEGMNDIFRKLHELDRKVSKLSRTLNASKSTGKG